MHVCRAAPLRKRGEICGFEALAFRVALNRPYSDGRQLKQQDMQTGLPRWGEWSMAECKRCCSDHRGCRNSKVWLCAPTKLPQLKKGTASSALRHGIQRSPNHTQV